MKAIESRRSIRKYLDKPVEEEKLQQILESARLAPSGSNTQPWHFIVIKSEEKRKLIADTAHDQQWMTTAPVIIVCVGDMQSRIADTASLIVDEATSLFELKQIIRDTAIAIEHIVLEAETQGLATCWVAWYTQDAIRPVLNIPADKFVVSIITLGYAGESPAQRPRKSLEEIVRYESW